jgi:hypothetical protein
MSATTAIPMNIPMNPPPPQQELETKTTITISTGNSKDPIPVGTPSSDQMDPQMDQIRDSVRFDIESLPPPPRGDLLENARLNRERFQRPPQRGLFDPTQPLRTNVTPAQNPTHHHPTPLHRLHDWLCCPCTFAVFCCLRAWGSRLVAPLKHFGTLKGICHHFTFLLLLTTPLVVFVALLAQWLSQAATPAPTTHSFVVVVLPLLLLFAWLIHRLCTKVLCRPFDPQLFLQEEGLNKTYLYAMLLLVLAVLLCAVVQLVVFVGYVDDQGGGGVVAAGHNGTAGTASAGGSGKKVCTECGSWTRIGTYI